MTHPSIWIDLTHKIEQGMPVYPGDPDVTFTSSRPERSGGFLVSQVSMGLHASTHVDAPRHVRKAAVPIDQIPIDRFVGEASVIRIKPESGVLPTSAIRAQYELLSHKHPRLLVDTSHACHWRSEVYFSHCPAFEADFPDWARSQGIELLGGDFPTFWFQDHESLGLHRQLFDQGILLMENLNSLERLIEEVYLIALPLSLCGLEASPVRAIAKNIISPRKSN